MRAILLAWSLTSERNTCEGFRAPNLQPGALSHGRRAHLCGGPVPLAAFSLAGEPMCLDAEAQASRGNARARRVSNGVRGAYAGRKGDGKKPRQPKSSARVEGSADDGAGKGGRQGSSGQRAAQQPVESGPRIRNDIGMSMKTQLRLVKAFKEMENKAKTGSRTVVRTGFRRKKATVQDNPDSSAPEMLRDIWNQKETPPHFFLDGYNIIGYWNKLKKKRDKGDMSGARDALFQEVSQFAHYRGCQCTLVYDAAGNVHGSASTQAEMRREGVEVVFVRDESADSYLEARAAELGSLEAKDGVRPPRCYIATSDRNVQSISGSRGAVIMSSTLFIQELKRAKREVEMDLLDMRQGSLSGSMVENLIDADSVDKLYGLMEQLEGRQIRAPRSPPPGGQKGGEG